MKKSQPQILAKLDHKDILGVRSPLKWGQRICEIALKLQFHEIFLKLSISNLNSQK